MTTFVDINVSRVGRRLKGVASVDGALLVSFADRLAGFSDAVVNVAAELAGSDDAGVRLVFDVDASLAEAVAAVADAREVLESALVERAEAVAAAGPALTGAGFTQGDAAVLLGLHRNAYREIVLSGSAKGSKSGQESDADKVSVSELWGRSVLGQEPASMDAGGMVLGGWVFKGERLVVAKKFPVAVEGLAVEVSRGWEKLMGPFEPEPVEDKPGNDSLGESEPVGDDSVEYEGLDSLGEPVADSGEPVEFSEAVSES